MYDIVEVNGNAHTDCNAVVNLPFLFDLRLRIEVTEDDYKKLQNLEHYFV